MVTLADSTKYCGKLNGWLLRVGVSWATAVVSFIRSDDEGFQQPYHQKWTQYSIVQLDPTEKVIERPWNTKNESSEIRL